MKKKIGVLGSGTVAQTLAAGFLKHGYQVTIGTRDPGKLADWKSKTGKGASVAGFADAAKFGEVIVLAVKGTAAEKAVELAGIENLAGKTVLDATNPIADAPPEKGVLSFFTSLNESLMEKLQKKAAKANLVKAFSSVGAALMVDPQLETKPSMFICGDSESAKKDAVAILKEFGWDSEDMGGKEAARSIEPLCILWCIPGFLRNDWVHAFKILRPA